MRDPTRGGLATALNELAEQAGVAVVLEETALPLRPAVVGTCEILGIDPLYVASEGRLIAVVAAESRDDALAILRSHPLGAEAAIVGEIARSRRLRPPADGFRRQPCRRHARRGSTAADLLAAADLRDRRRGARHDKRTTSVEQ